MKFKLPINCIGSRATFNSVTSHLDANFVYGSDQETAKKLRTFRGGLLKSNPVFRSRGLKDLLPSKVQDPDGGCPRPSRDVFCFEAGLFFFFRFLYLKTKNSFEFPNLFV